MAVATPSRSPPSRVRSLASMATSVPLPMAIPRSAWTSAGASLTPSPTIATVLPWACRRAISPTLSAGMTSASARSMPTLAAIAAAVVAVSPNNIATSRPMACSRATCSAAPGLSVSATASTPRTSPCQPAHTTVLPCRSSRSAAASNPSGTPSPASAASLRRPTHTVTGGWPGVAATAARTPAPASARWRESRLRVDITGRAQPKQERPPMTDSSSSLGQRQAPEFDSSVPQTARIWNYWLGGKDYFPVDQAVGEQIREAFQASVENARSSRALLVRAVRYLAGEAGIRQFLDIGTGLPTANNTHQVAQAVAPECRIVYVDNDPLVLAHARALLTSSPEGATAYLDADLHEPNTILQAAAETLDFSQPIAIMLMEILGHIEDDDEAQSIVKRLVGAVPSGSYLTMNDSTDTSAEVVEAARIWNQSANPTYHLRSPERIARFFDGLELVEPGVVSPPRWRPDPSPSGLPAGIDSCCGVARKP